MRGNLCTAAILLALGSAVLRAQEPRALPQHSAELPSPGNGGIDPRAADLESEFLLRTWDSVEDVLLPTFLRSVTQTGDGNIWLGAYDGVVRFNGLGGYTFSADNTAALPRPLRGDLVHADAAGRLWCSTLDGGLFCRENEIWRRRDDWRGGGIRRFTGGPDGQIVVSTDGPPVRIAPGAFTPVSRGGLPEAVVRGAVVEFSADGELWMLAGGNLYYWENQDWAALPARGPVTALAPGRVSGVWAAFADRVEHWEKGGVGRSFPLPPGFAGGGPLLMEDSRGNVWTAGAESGLRVRMSDGRVLEPRRHAGDAPVRVTSLFEDRERNILVSTAGAGLARFRPKVFDLVLARQGGLSGMMVNAVAPAAGDSRMFLATMGGGLVLSTRDGKMETIPPDLQPVPAKLTVTSLATAPDGSLLAAFFGYGLQRITAGQAKAVPGSAALKGKTVRALFEKNGVIHIGCDEAFFFLREGTLSPVAEITEKVSAIVEDSEGTVWVAAGHERRRIRADGTSEPVPVPGAPDGRRIVTMRPADGGGLWISFLKTGIARVRGDKAEWLTGENRLPLNMIGAIIETRDDLWLSGESGIVKLPKTSFPNGTKERLPARLFNRFDGLASDLFRRGNQSAAEVDSGGGIWFASHKGAAVLDPARVLTSAYEAPARVLSVHSERLPQGRLITRENQGSIDLPAGSKHIWLSCTAPTTGQPELLQMEYRLEGFGNAWTTVTGQRVIRFYNLPPGTYQFHLRSMGGNGFYAGPAQQVSLHILPYFWETTWFRVTAGTAAGLGLGLMVWALTRRRMARKASRLEAQAEGNLLRAQLAEARQAEAIGRLAGGIAHDFNNLLTAILGNAELARIDNGFDPELCRQLDDIVGAGVRARDLIGQILAYSKRQRTEMRPVDLAPVLHESVRLLRSGMPSSVVLDHDIPRRLPPVMADPAEIQRILMNLGGNAGQALGPAGGVVGFRAMACLPGQPCLKPWAHFTPDGCVLVTVEDNGHGMDDETIEKIFDPFFTTKDVGRGTGLGLAVVRGIVESHGGHVTVTSAPGRGSTFHVALPICQEPEPAEKHHPAGANGNNGGEKKSGAGPLPPRGAGERVLVVDDEAQILEISRRTLHMLGYDPVACGTPAEALERFEKSPADFRLAILDFAMPDMNGADLARRLRALHPTIPIILCTGYGGAIDEEAARGFSVTQVLGKPFQLEVFAATVASALREGARAK